jgi:nucleotide-binding universal stress UspA family protein
MDVLLPIKTYPDVVSNVGLGQALSLSTKLGARVNALVQEVEIAPMHSALGEALLGVSNMASEAEALNRDQAGNIGKWVEERAASLELPLEVAALRCSPVAFIDRLLPITRYHDLTALVLDGADPGQRAHAEAVIFGSGGPVMVVPSRQAAVPVAELRSTPLKVVIAWDGGQSAARALRDAMPILTRADVVSIVTVGDDKTVDTVGLSGIKSFLQRRGVKAQHLPRTRGTSPIGDILQSLAISQEADLLVMGAVRRNRVQEVVLGGATQSILRALRLPVLLSH